MSKSLLVQIEESYNKRIDDTISQLADSMADMVSVSKIGDKDKFKVAQEEYQMEIQAANIVRSAESLLTLITELKQALLLNDTKTLTHLSKKRLELLRSQKDEIKSQMLSVRDGFDSIIPELEEIYLHSLSSL